MTKPYLVPAIKRAFEIIDLLAKQDAGLTISDIHRELKLPLSSAATILYTLKTLGYLDRDPRTSRYCLSTKMLSVSQGAVERIDIVGRCHGLLEGLVKESGLTGHVAVLREGESMYIDRVPGAGLIQFSSYIGMRWPAHASAVGKAILSALPETELQSFLKKYKLDEVTERTITSKTALGKQLKAFRRLGYAMEMNEGEIGVACVAAPVPGPGTLAGLGISVTGTTHQITKSELPTLGALVRKYAGLMGLRLGVNEPRALGAGLTTRLPNHPLGKSTAGTSLAQRGAPRLSSH